MSKASSRRDFLAGSLGAGTALWVGCSGGSAGRPDVTVPGPETAAPTGPIASTVSAATSAPAGKGSAPEFSLPLLEGGIMSLSEHLGSKVILVDFWATTCHPCLEELPHLSDIYVKYKDRGFVVLAVAGDGPETRRDVSKVVREKKLKFPILLDEETTVIARYNPKKEMPFWVLIDKAGNIVKKKNGYDPGDEAMLTAEIEKLLGA